jgi:hypothetical protein
MEFFFGETFTNAKFHFFLQEKQSFRELTFFFKEGCNKIEICDEVDNLEHDKYSFCQSAIHKVFFESSSLLTNVISLWNIVHISLNSQSITQPIIVRRTPCSSNEIWESP